MPQIIRNEKQEQALKTISSALEEVSQINTILSAGDYRFRIHSIGGAKGRVDIGQPLSAKIVAVLLERKRTLVREVKAEAKANRISFSEEDIILMDRASSEPRLTGEKEKNCSQDDENKDGCVTVD